MPKVDDRTVAAACAGDAAAFRAVYQSLAPAVLGYLRAKGVSDPESVTSDVFLGLLPRLPGLTGGASGLRKLTFAVAHARVADEYRQRERRPGLVEYRPEVDGRTVASAESDATVLLASSEVLSTLAQLPADQRDVLALRFVADLSLEQVADIIGRSVGAVKQLQRRGLLTVRAILAERGVTR